MNAVALSFLVNFLTGWSVVTPLVNCPTVCPLESVQYTCENATVGTAEWRLWNRTTNDLLTILIPTGEQKEASECLEGVTFTAEVNTSLWLFFSAKPQTEHIRITCCIIVMSNMICDDCNVTIRSPPSSPNLSSTTLPNNSVHLSWLPPSDDPLCVEYYVVNVTSEYNTTLVTTNSTSLLLGHLEPGEYEFSVAGVDALNRTGDYSSASTNIVGDLLLRGSFFAQSLPSSAVTLTSSSVITKTTAATTNTTPLTFPAVEVISGVTAVVVVVSCTAATLVTIICSKLRKHRATRNEKIKQSPLQCQRVVEQVYLETERNPAYGFSQPRECVQLSSSQDEPDYEQVDVSAETGFNISTNIAYSTVNI